jgi:outer membrane autotransporter protein
MISSNGLVSGYRSTSTGLAGGYDRMIDQALTVGVTFGWSHSTTNARSYTAGSTFDQIDLGIYGTVRFGSVRIAADGFYGSTDAKVKRDTQGGGIALATFAGRGYGTALRVSAPLPGGVLTPFGELRWTHQSCNALVEDGAGELDFAIAGQSRNSGHGVIGARFQQTYGAGKGTITPHVEIGLDHMIGATDRTVSGSLNGISGSSFAGLAVTQSRTGGIVRLGGVAQLSQGIELYGDLDGKVSANRHQVDGTVGLRMRF